MDKIADFIILYIVCATSGIIIETGVSMVTAMLVSVIFVCADIFFGNKKFSILLKIIYIMASLKNPGYIFFLPIIMYNALYKERYIPVICAFVMAYQSYKMPLIIPAALLSICLAVKTYNLEKYRRKYYEALEHSNEADEQIRMDRMERIKNQEADIKVATLAERNRIAREIHDNVGHMLTRSILQVGALKVINKDKGMTEQLDMLQETLDSAMQNIRKSVHDIKDEAVDFGITVNGLINEYDSPEITFDNGLTSELSKEIKYCFISVIKEALTNVVKHSNADRVEIILREHPALYQLMIKDNGTGIKGIQGEGIGLMNMRILVIDDDKLVAVSLKTILESDENIEVADIGYSGREAVDLYESVQPDVLLMDIRMDGMSGLDAATEILQKHPDAKILLLTTFSDDEYIIKALAIGTKGYIIKQDFESIIPAVKAVNMGQSVFGGEVASRLNGMVNAKKASGIEEKLQNISESVLTDKELEVAEQVAKGLNNKEIGEVLCLSEGTVRNYISFCLEKTGLRDRTQLAIWYLSGK